MKLHTYIEDPEVIATLKAVADHNERSVAKETTRILREYFVLYPHWPSAAKRKATRKRAA